jgi:hypothetical protein
MLRGFVDTAGVEWRVWEVFPGKGPTKRRAAAALSRSSLNGTAFADGWLCFESDKEKRRLAPIPRGWESHDKKTLEALCGKATLVPARHARRVNGSA